MRILLLISVTILLFGCGSSTNGKVDFNNQVRPILNDKCLACHGGVKQQGDLSFLFPETAVLPARSGKYAIIPGDVGRSELVARIKHQNPELRMPLEGDPLSEEEIQVLEQWINQGAEWADHWAYVPPDQDLATPDIDDLWGYNEIDAFVWRRAADIGLLPSEEVEKTTLIRRVSLDLIGLPPSVEETQAFIDDTSDDAFEKVVDRLLANPHFGERWASMWLDLARYADSRGYQKDVLRPEMWRYRDWVIHAFNQDLPFDQFTLEQLAGDLLPNRSESQLLATAFHRNTMTNDEGGTDDEEFRVAAVIDRLNTTMEVWQGVTIGCVQCHSHPYDPIKHKEFYNLLAFFNNTTDRDDGRDSPTADLYSPAQIISKNNWKEALTQLENKGDTLSDDYKEALSNYMSILPGRVPVMQEHTTESSRETRVFERGNWLVHGEEVSPDVPESFPAFGATLEKNRLGLAKWILDKGNPLTARVMVNRIWEQLFGQGLVITLEDFGTQSEKPSHPDLLDWLSYQYIHGYKWSTKSLLKQIVMSATYRQSSKVTDEELAIDPNNKYLARGPRYRLSAEQIRDQALSISGLLNPTIYGKSVMPYQPEGVWNVIRHTAKWERAHDGNQYRRGLYTFWRRVSPYPSMLSFDTPTRELCVSRRIRTNTPLQALITLNDPVFVEAAEALAKRMKSGGTTIQDQINYGYQRALMRRADPATMNMLQDFYRSTKMKYENSDVDPMIDSDLMTMVQVASIILNLDEVIMKT